ncbi:restriction endonuclease subunit S [Pseudomonas aeruginosa]|uniref:restriction endonuclease subunit S n=1 Tax=Pseudomonas aeruginosa TaxID=287 RepID=UPI000FD34412|nr:restriction endonuclease subunit S [Pseudomonas aeruginosa]MCD2825854.1 restriction endonuclease subunit S [Pseudomonas aeruginosa]MCD2831884.1 restriction endonuclease subunit S [Pseudomonas aeruginosa]RUI10966.1 restriction endonuclease subunit S [Pseudomonas aeruginosa]HCF4145010.1 restriction endonuclease subunit S [Pseudomonas aeruginosa]
MSLPGSWVQTTVRAVVEDIQPGFAQRPGEEDEGTTPQIRTHNVTPGGKISLEGIKHITASEKELARYSLAVGDVVFNNTNSEEWVGKTAVFDQKGEYVFSNHMTRLRVRRELICPEYLASYLQLLWSMGYTKTRAKRWVSQAGIESDTLSSFKIPLPPLPEQQRIVDVLRQAEMVAKLRREFDELLVRTKRQLFVEMFGDPNPKSNTRWPVVKLGKFVTVATGGTPSREQADSYGTAHAWVKSTDLKDGLIVTTEERLSELGIQRSNAKPYPKQTIMLAMYGQGQTRGRTGKLLIDAACNQACAALLPSDELLPDYLWIWLQLSYEAVRALGRGGQQENLNLEIVRGIQLPKPPIPLQQEFARRLACLLDLFKQSQAANEQFSTLLEELQIEALTGDSTASWRELHSDEIAEAAHTRDTLLRERGTKIVLTGTDSISFTAQTDLTVRPARHWLLGELSEFQRQVLAAFTEYCQQSGQPLLVEDPEVFASFCDDAVVTERLQAFGQSHGNRIRRSLSQLAALGLIAKITLPKQDPDTKALEYLKAFRPVRPFEYTKHDDVEKVRRAMLTFRFVVALDYETSQRAGAGGMFQVADLRDEKEASRIDLVDQGKHYSKLKDLAADIARRMRVAPHQIVLEE